MRALTLPERTRLAGNFVVYAALDIVDANGVWVDVSALLGGDWVLSAELSQELDNVVGQATFTLAREGVTAALGPVSLAPLVGTSPANNGGPLLDYERPIRYRTAVLAPGSARPAANDASWRHVFLGKVSGIDAASTSNQITVAALDEGARLADAWIRDPTVYSDDAGTLVEVVMERIRLDWASFTSSIVVPASPGWMIKTFQQESASVLAALRDKLALQIGWDFRYRWTGPTTFVPVFQRPERAAPAVQATFAPSEYLTIPRLGGTGDEIRNIGRVSFFNSTTQAQETVTGSNAASIARFGGAGRGERWAEIILGGDSNIDSPVEAQALLDAMLSDLGFPSVTVDIETMYWWPAEIGDFYQFGANGDFFTSDQQFAVVGIKHSITREQQRTTLTVRGVPAAAYRTWFDLPGTVGGEPPTLEPLKLLNFRVKSRTTTAVTFGWDGLSADAEEIDVYLSTVSTDTPTSEVWPTDSTVPTAKLDPTVLEYTVTYPDLGNVTYAEFLPLATDTLEPGDAERVTVNSAGAPPRFGNLSSILGPTGLTTTLALEVIDPQTFDGTLAAWLNHDAIDDADLTTAPDGTLDIAATPYTVTGNDDFVQPFGTQEIMRDVKVHPNKSKAIYFEFVNARGTSTGKRRFTIMGGGGIIDETGQLVDQAIIRAQQFAGSVKPPIVVDMLPAYPAALGIVIGNTVVLVDAAHPGGLLYRWTGIEWKPLVNAPELDGQVIEQQIADAAVSTTKFANDIAPVTLVTDFSSPPPDAKSVIAFDGTSLKRWAGGAWTDAIPAVSLIGQLTGSQIGADAIGPLQLAANAVIAAKVALGAIDTSKIVDNAITAAKLGAAAVTAAALGAAAVTAAALGAAAVTATALAAAAVTATSIASGAITTPKLATGAVDTAALQAGAITASTIAVGAITTPKLAAGAVDTAALQAGAVTAGTIAAGAITTSKFTAGAVDAMAIAAGAVSTIKLAAGAVTANEIATAAITTIKLAAGSVDALSIAAGAITAGKIAANAVTVGTIAANAVTASTIAANAVTANALAANSVIAGKIAAAAISTTELAANAVTAAKIAANTITAAQIAARTITAAQIATGTLTANEIQAGSISGDRLIANTITAGLIAAGAITTNAIAAGAVTASKLTVSVLSGPGGINGGTYVDLGIVVSGRLNALSSGAYLDLNAIGAGAILYHPSVALYANGNAVISGTIASNSFTATWAEFQQRVRAGAAADGARYGFYVWDYYAGAPAIPQYTTYLTAGVGLRAELYGRYGIDIVTGGSAVQCSAYFDANGGLTVGNGMTFFVGSGCYVGFYGASPIAKQSVSGSRSSGAALQDLLTKLDSIGLFYDFTSA